MKQLKKMFLTALAIGVVTMSACKKDKDNFNMGDQEFVTEAGSANIFEVAAGNLAVQKSANTTVKAYGNHMVTDHNQATSEMTTLATQKGWTLPGVMLKKHQDKIDALNAMTGTEFDRQYAAIMVTSHQETIALFENASRNDGVPDGDLRTLAAGKLPTLREHLQHAQELQAQVGQ